MRTLVIPLLLQLLFVAVGFTQAQPANEIANVFTKEFAGSWRASDPIGLATLWTEDGEWMSMVGSRTIYKGRPSIAEVWEVGLHGRTTTDQLKIEVEIDQVIFLSPTIAHVDLVMTFGTVASGIMREAMTAIVVKPAVRWKIRTARVARLQD